MVDDPDDSGRPARSRRPGTRGRIARLVGAIVRRAAAARRARSMGRRMGSIVRERPYRAGAAGLSVVAGLAVFLIAVELFPYHSVNHDEAVYLQGADLLLEGRLGMTPREPGAVRPWFFLSDGGYQYPKYAPVPAAMFAAGELLGGYRIALGLAAAGNVLLTYALTAAAFDRPTGVAAAALLALTPWFLLTSAVFLPYAPTTLLNLLFATAYVRAARRARAAAEDGSDHGGDQSRNPAIGLGGRLRTGFGVDPPTVGYAALAGLAIGLSFFGRPYTAVLFAAPFVLHALWTVARGGRTAVRARRSRGDRAGGQDSAGGDRRDGRRLLRAALLRTGTTGLLGAAFVGVALAYNARMTGDPLLFPFEAFAPRDGLGFGRRRILDHAVDYTPALALRANARLLYETGTRWTVAAPVGTVLFAVGLGRFLSRRVARWTGDRVPSIRRGDRNPGDRAGGTDDGTGSDDADGGDGDDADPRERPPVPGRPPGLSGVCLRWLLVGLVASVVVGNLYFWGNYNVLGTLSDPTDGFVAGFGPFYHFDLLVPLSAFGAAGLLATACRVRRGVDRRLRTAGVGGRGRRIAVAVLVLTAAVGGAGLQAAALDGPVADHRAYTDRYAETYAPVEDRQFDRALVFVPATYGRWLNHPFQSLRNDPGPDGRLEGEVVYALDRTTAEDFATLAAYKDRRPYRFTYRGEWTPDPADRVTPRLYPLRVRSGRSIAVTTRVATPPNVRSGSVRLAADGEGDLRILPETGANVTVRWRVRPSGAQIASVRVDGDPVGDGPNEDRADDGRTGGNATDAVPIDDPSELSLAVTFVTPDGASLTYRQELDVRAVDGRVEVVWPPESSVCRLVTDCGLRGTYLPDRPEERPAGTWMDWSIAVDGGVDGDSDGNRRSDR